MNSSLLFHLIRKDIQATRSYYILMWAGMLCAFLSPCFSGYLSRWALLGAFPALFLPVLLQMDSFQFDSAHREECFWATRPIPPGMLVLSKIILFFGVSVLPLLLMGLSIKMGNKEVETLGEIMRMLTEGFLICVSIGGITAALSAFTRNLIQFIFGAASLLFLVIGFFVVIEWLNESLKVALRLTMFTPFNSFGGIFAMFGVAGYAMVFARFFRKGWGTHVCIFGSVILINLLLRFSVSFYPYLIP